jgi:ribonucleoside-diphosphate reductase alpha chain
VTISINDVTEQRKTVFLDRYAKKDSKGEPVEKDFKQMWSRVAIAIADDEFEKEQFYSILEDFKFVPGGRILAGAGVGTEQTFYNCYVIPVEPKQSTLAAIPEVGNDSREAIFDTIATMVDIMSRGGGVGINWSVLRPSGSYLSRVSGTSSGPVGWMDVASKAVGEVEQGGSRRGAAMFMLDDWHPDVLNFINAKRDLGKITNANVSVSVSDEFMLAVRNDALWMLVYPSIEHPAYNTEWDGDIRAWRKKGYPVNIVKSIRARKIWDAIVDGAWHNGEPGVVFLDRYNKESTGAAVERIISVNPCGEQGLGSYSVCNLGSMNLAAYVREGSPVDQSENEFDWEAFSEDVSVAVRFLDNVIDKSFYWDDRSKRRQTDLRRIGLGVMGLADTLIALGIRYGSDDAVKFTKNVFQLMKDKAIQTSLVLAQEKGPAKAYSPAMWDRPYLAEYNKRHNKFGALRNLFFLTQAPTGTTSILAGVNSGIEPYFAAKYTRKDRTGTHEVYAAPWANYYKGRTDLVAHSPVTYPDYFVTANDVTVEEHIAMQAAVQKYVDSSVSKTINAPNSHKVEDVDKAYRLAYDSGLKGISYFRDGCGRDQVLSTEASKSGVDKDDYDEVVRLLEWHQDRNAQLEEEVLFGSKTEPYRRPKTVSGYTSRVNTSMGTMYLTVNSGDDGNPVEVFVNVGKAGSDVMAMGEAIGRLISLNLQNGVPFDKVSSQLTGVGGTSSFNPGLVHALGKALENHESPVKAYEADPPSPETVQDVKVREVVAQLGSSCPECKEFSLVREEGCLKCYSCGYSAC